MYKKIIFVLLVIILTACTENKSVTKELNIREINRLVKKDSDYEDVLIKVDYIRKKIGNNLVLKNKFRDFTFKDYLHYEKTRKNTSFIKVMNIQIIPN